MYRRTLLLRTTLQAHCHKTEGQESVARPATPPLPTQTTELLTHGGDASMVTCGTLTLCTVHQKHIALVTVGHIDEETWPDTDTLHRCEEANKGKEQVALEEEMQPLQGTKSTVGPSKPHLHGNGVDNLQHK